MHIYPCLEYSPPSNPKVGVEVWVFGVGWNMYLRQEYMDMYIALLHIERDGGIERETSSTILTWRVSYVFLLEDCVPCFGLRPRSQGHNY